MKLRVFGYYHNIFYIIALFCMSFILKAQTAKLSESSLYFDHITIKDGLSQSSIYSIYQDSSGFMWIGTRDGLNRYDGYKFEVYRHNMGDSISISGNIINDIKEDKDGNIWIATEKGISKYDAQQQIFYNYSLDSTIYRNPAVDVIYITRKNIIWIGGSFGMFSFDTENETFSNNIFKESNQGSTSFFSVNTIIEDSDNKLWIGTSRSGVYVWNLHHNILSTFETTKTNKQSLKRIEALVVEDAIVWVGTYGNGLFKFDKDGNMLAHYHSESPNKQYRISNNNIRTLLKDDDGLWIGTFNGLNIIQQPYDLITINYQDGNTKGLSHSSIRSLFKDSKGSIWIGTYFGGISIFDKDNQRFQHFYNISGDKGSLSYDVVGAFSESNNGKFYIGTERGGLNIYDTRTNFHSKIADSVFEQSTIKSLYTDTENTLWVGVFKKGLHRYDRKQKKFIPLSPFTSLKTAIINCIVPDDHRNLWIGTDEKGLQRFGIKERQFEKFLNKEKLDHVIKKKPIKAISIKNDQLYIATKGSGIILFKPNDGTIQQIRQFRIGDEILDINEFNHLFWDTNGILWLATNGDGLLSFDPKKETYKRWHLASGLSSNIVLGTMEDSTGSIWAMTMNGLSKINNDQSKVLKNYSNESGFPLEEVNEGAFFKSRTNEFLIGGSNGYVRFTPKSIISNRYSPQPVLTSLSVMNKMITPNDETKVLQREVNKTSKITLNHSQSIFSFEFASLSYLRPENNQYAYKLEGFDLDWVYCGTRREASYTNLPDGEYTFYIKSANNDGVWNEKPTSLQIKILPPPWRTWWAYVIYTIMIILGFYTIRYNAVKSTQLKSNLKIEQLEKEKWKEVHDLKLKYFIDVSHEFRTPLSLILGPLEDMIGQENQDNWVRSRIKIMYFNAKRLLLLIEQILEIREVETGHSKLKKEPLFLSNVLHDIIDSFRVLADKNKINLSLKQYYSDEVYVLGDKNKFEKIFFNLLSNAFKFTPKGGRITLSVKEKKEKDQVVYYFKLSDTGIGISTNKLPKIFNRFYKENKENYGAGIGLSLTKSLIELMDGTIDVTSIKGKGTSFTLIIPFETAKSTLTKDKESVPFVKPIPLEYQNITLANVTDVETDKKKGTILIVEDNEELRNYLEKQLEASYTIITAKNGVQGLKKAKKKGPDILISDVMMPKMDGFELCKLVKKTKELCHIPIILLTAKNASHHKLEGLEYGADDYISKPFNLVELKTRIKNILYNRNLVQQKFKDNNSLKASNEITINSYDEKLMKKFINIVKEQVDKPNFTVDYIGREIGLSRVHLTRKIKALTGMTPAEFIKHFRMKQAMKMLKDNSFRIADIAYAVGYQDVQYFSKSFKKHFGKSPTQYVKKTL